jgi:hypothetical protein
MFIKKFNFLEVVINTQKCGARRDLSFGMLLAPREIIYRDDRGNPRLTDG